MCSVVTSAAVPTGMGSTLGNKGGVGLYFQVGNTKLLIVNAHLAAHQTAEKRRNAEFNRINRMIPALLEKKEAALVAKTPTAAAGGGRFSLGFMSTKVSPTPGGTKQSESASGTPTKADSIVAVAPAHAVLPGVETIVNEQGRVMGEVAYGEDEGSEQGESRVASPKPTVELDSIQEEISPLTALATVPVPEVSADAAGTTRRCEGGVDAGSVATGNLDASGAAEVEAAIAGESAGSGAAFNTNAAVGSDAAVTGGTLNSHVTSVTAEASSVIGMLAAAGVRATDEAPAFEDGDTDVNKVNALDGTAILDVPVGAVKTLERMADLVVFMGDLNYRIKGNRYSTFVLHLLKSFIHLLWCLKQENRVQPGGQQHA